MIQRVLFRDGYDAYVDDFEFMQDTVEALVEQQLMDITVSGGVARGLTCTAIVDAVEVDPGVAYDTATRAQIVLDATTPVAVGAGDTDKFVVIENVSTDSMLDQHPVLTGMSAYRRREQVATLSVTAAPTSTQVALCKITAVSLGNPPTINTDSPNREILSLGVGTSGGSVTNPYFVVANDGSGDHLTLAAAVAALPPGGGMIRIKAGTYDLTAIVTVALSNVRIEGAGTSTILRVDGSAISHAIAVNGSGVGGITNVTIANIEFDWMGGDPGAGQDNMGIRVLDATNVIISQCNFKDSQGVTNPKGIKAENGAIHLKIVECHFDALNKCILLNASATAGDSTIQGCSGTDVRYGIHADANFDRMTIVANNFEGDGDAAGRGLLIEQTNDDWSLAGNVVANFGMGVLFDGNGFAAAGNCITGSTSNGISFSTNSDNAVAIANDLRNNGTPIANTGNAGNIITPNIT